MTNIIKSMGCKGYLLFTDIFSILLSIIFQFKFESTYWLHKGSEVNHTAGFSDIFHDWTFILFLFCPLLIVSQVFISLMVEKWYNKIVTYAKIIAYIAVLIIANIKKVSAEFTSGEEHRTFKVIIICGILFTLYMLIVNKFLKEDIPSYAWYVPIILSVIGILIIL